MDVRKNWREDYLSKGTQTASMCRQAAAIQDGCNAKKKWVDAKEA